MRFDRKRKIKSLLLFLCVKFSARENNGLAVVESEKENERRDT